MTKSSSIASHGSNFGLDSASNPPSISRTSTQDLAAPGGTGCVKKGKPTDTSSRFKDMLKSRKAKKQKEDDAKSK
jgi:hypothetical protein